MKRIARRWSRSLSLFALAAIGCASTPGASSDLATHRDGGAPSRFFGNMPLVVDPNHTNGLYHFGPHHIATDDNLLALHLDWFPIPWRELAAGTPPPAAWQTEMDHIAALEAELALPVYLALSPIDGSRDRLRAQAIGETTLDQDNTFAQPCEAIASRPDYATVIRPGYHAIVRYLVDRFRPSFLALSMEVNLYQQTCPTAWPDMKALINEVYDEQKVLHPDLPVFQTYQVEALWQSRQMGDPCFGYARTCLAKNWAPLADLKSDLFAMSVYPVLPFDNNGRTLPADYLDVFQPLTGMPLAVAESGYPAQTISAQPQGATMCIAGLPSSPNDQNAWAERLTSDAVRLNMPFAVWWNNEDIMPANELLGCDCTDGSSYCNLLHLLGDAALGFRFFGANGLREFDGTPRPALAPWTAAVTAAQSP